MASHFGLSGTHNRVLHHDNPYSLFFSFSCQGYCILIFTQLSEIYHFAKSYSPLPYNFVKSHLTYILSNPIWHTTLLNHIWHTTLTQLVSPLIFWLSVYETTKVIYCLPITDNSSLQISWNILTSQVFFETILDSL